MQLEIFAARSDFERLFEIVFREELLRVFEADSRIGERCREFHDIDDLRAAYPRFTGVHLALWAPTTGRMSQERIALDPSPGAAKTFRHSVTGWGLIQLLLGDARTKVITPTRIAHNSAARAATWGQRRGAVDYKVIGQISGRIRRALEKLAVAKAHIAGQARGARLVCPEAARLVTAGYALKSAAGAPWSYTLST